MVLLIKPQFEAGKENIEKGGVVKDKKVHSQVIQNVIDCAGNLGYSIKGLTYSAIKGPSGNIEYLLWITTENEDIPEPSITAIVNEAFEKLA